MWWESVHSSFVNVIWSNWDKLWSIRFKVPTAGSTWPHVFSISVNTISHELLERIPFHLTWTIIKDQRQSNCGCTKYLINCSLNKPTPHNYWHNNQRHPDWLLQQQTSLIIFTWTTHLNIYFVKKNLQHLLSTKNTLNSLSETPP